MTDNPTPQPDDEQLPQVGWWCWRGDNHGHLATTACRSDNVPIHVPAEWADEMAEVIQKIEDGDDEEPTEALSVEATHSLSVQHADALWDAVAIPGPTEPTFPMQHDRVCRAVAEILAAVAAAPSRTDGLREAAELAAKDAEAESLRGHRYKAKREIAHKLRRLAAEAPQPDTETPHPPHDSWLVEWSADGDEWAVAYPTHDHGNALDRLARGRQDAPEWQWRLVRETTSYTVEVEQDAPAAAGPGRAADTHDDEEACDGEQGDLDERARIQHETVRDVAAGLRHLAGEADPMVGSLARDGFGPDEIAGILARPAVRPAVETGA